MHRFVIAFALTAAGLAWGSSAQAMSCQNRLVTVGDSIVRVQSLCGEPTAEFDRVVHRTRAVHRRVNGVVVTDRVTVAVTLKVWVYDFGPTRFMRELVFEAGRLSAIDTLGYGTASASASGTMTSLERDQARDRRARLLSA